MSSSSAISYVPDRSVPTLALRVASGATIGPDAAIKVLPDFTE